MNKKLLPILLGAVVIIAIVLIVFTQDVFKISFESPAIPDKDVVGPDDAEPDIVEPVTTGMVFEEECPEWCLEEEEQIEREWCFFHCVTGIAASQKDPEFCKHVTGLSLIVPAHASVELCQEHVFSVIEQEGN